MNKVIIDGRLTADPKLIQSYTDITKFTLAVKGRAKDKVDFINFVAFNELGEKAYKQLYKGVKVMITGRLHQGKYINKDGMTVYNVNVHVSEFEIVEHTKLYKESHDRQRIEEPAYRHPKSDYEEIMAVGKMFIYDEEPVNYNERSPDVQFMDIDKMLREIGVDVDELPFK